MFDLFYHDWNPSGPLIERLMYFRIRLQFRQDIRSQSPRRAVWLCCVMHTTELDSVVWCTPQSLTLPSTIWCTPRNLTPMYDVVEHLTLISLTPRITPRSRTNLNMSFFVFVTSTSLYQKQFLTWFHFHSYRYILRHYREITIIKPQIKTDSW